VEELMVCVSIVTEESGKIKIGCFWPVLRRSVGPVNLGTTHSLSLISYLPLSLNAGAKFLGKLGIYCTIDEVKVVKLVFFSHPDPGDDSPRRLTL
jgi:hypothetical protein